MTVSSSNSDRSSKKTLPSRDLMCVVSGIAFIVSLLYIVTLSGCGGGIKKGDMDSGLHSGDDRNADSAIRDSRGTGGDSTGGDARTVGRDSASDKARDAENSTVDSSNADTDSSDTGGHNGAVDGDSARADKDSGNDHDEVITDLCFEPPTDSSEGEMQTASRTSGVAPLAVHFSAVGSASGVAQPQGGDFDELNYSWNFGDNNGGNWEIDGHSRNCATGFVAGHVFESPGTYTVRLKLISSDLNTTYYKQVIEVLNPEDIEAWRTFYVSTDGSNSNTGTSEDSPLETFDQAMSNAGPNTRILLRRGDSWQSEGVRIDANGPGIIGAYGTGTKPSVRFTSGDGIVFGWSSENRDWRLVGLRLEGTATGTAIKAEGTDLNQLLVLDVEIESWGRGIVLSADCDQMDQIAIAASTIRDIRSSWPIFMGGTRSFIQGNYLDKQNTDESHTYRNWCANGLSVTHNHFAPAYHHCMKLHSPDDWVEGELYSQNIVISDNVFEGSVWTVGIGPENDSTNEPVRNVRYERNLHLRDSNTDVSIKVWAVDVTIRNNVFINNTGGSFQAIVVERRGIEPPPQGTRIYHNTFFAEQGSITPVSIDDNATDTEVCNNLLAPLTGDFTINGTGSGFAQSNNLAIDTSAFVDTTERDFTPASTSPAINAGIDVGVLFDFNGAKRDEKPDVGAYESQDGS